MNEFDNTLNIDNDIIESIKNMIKTQNYKIKKNLVKIK